MTELRTRYTVKLTIPAVTFRLQKGSDKLANFFNVFSVLVCVAIVEILYL
ncbi:hypothetical protein DY000_02055432 [Brassica cretica]|uniref:Uncharacterized protein n=1 Tax=Brassica cretica TaxID=69181 RepID=A0ABQ7A9W5_BRACR|nr:hypothetical protein DY000_02055432 [Brassica cretica]